MNDKPQPLLAELAEENTKKLHQLQSIDIGKMMDHSNAIELWHKMALEISNNLLDSNITGKKTTKEDNDAWIRHLSETYCIPDVFVRSMVSAFAILTIVAGGDTETSHKLAEIHKLVTRMERESNGKEEQNES